MRSAEGVYPGGKKGEPSAKAWKDLTHTFLRSALTLPHPNSQSQQLAQESEGGRHAVRIGERERGGER